MIRGVAIRALSAMFTAIFVAAVPTQATLAVIYVDDDSTGGSGTSWADAYPRLTDAIAAAQAGGQIRIAGGVYRPDESAAYPTGSGNRAASFLLSTDVTIKGGYAGLADSANPDRRDISAFETILSGDLNEDDGPYFANRNDNSKHVVYIIADAVLDGVTISGGQS
ncbi:MAG: hypothetical protein JXO22_18415, partial [Phycisphaerae bacterium]|nr:hypothetical protein [Phycisphaerae bacterium]